MAQLFFVAVVEHVVLFLDVKQLLFMLESGRRKAGEYETLREELL